MGSVRLRFSELGFRDKAPLILRRTWSKPSSGSPANICCGLRRGAREPLWRGSVLSTETIQAVQALKLAKRSPRSSPERMHVVFRSRIGRLLKADLIAVLAELRRQNEWEIALQVFAFIQKEVWYKPDLSLYNDMIFMLGKNKLIEIAEQLFCEIKKVGLQPNTRAYTEMIGAYLQAGLVEKAMDIYKLMKESDCNPDRLTLTMLIRNLEMAREEVLASAVRKDCAEYVDYPEKFLKEVDKKHAQGRPYTKSPCKETKPLKARKEETRSKTIYK